MRLFTSLPAIPALALGLSALMLAACSPYPTNPNQQLIDKENKLSAAGFKKLPIKSETQLADFKSIPAHLIRPATYKGKIVYLYADPSFCGCLYVGGTKAYNTYLQGAQTRYIAEKYKEATTDDGYTASPWMLDGGPWDDADMYGAYID